MASFKNIFRSLHQSDFVTVHVHYMTSEFFRIIFYWRKHYVIILPFFVQSNFHLVMLQRRGS